MLRFFLRPRVRRAFRLGARAPGQLDAELDDELRLHLELRAAQLARQGLDPAAAEREALRRFGAASYSEARRRLALTRRDAEHTMHRRDWLDALRQDLGYTLRQLGRAPGFTLAVVGTLGLALAATATMFGVIDRLLLQPPPHLRAPEALGRVFISVTSQEEGTTRTFSSTSYPLYERLRDRDGAPFELAATYREAIAVGAPGSLASSVDAEFVSPGYFSLLGVRPAFGRLLADAEAHHASAARAMVVSHGYWQRVLGGDAGAVGRTLLVRGNPYTVVGVAPRGFTGAELDAVDVWLPMVALDDGTRATRELFTTGFNVRFALVARVRPGFTREQSAALIANEFTAERQEMRRQFGFPDEGVRYAVRVAPLTGALGHDMQRPAEATVAVWLGGTALVLLLVACANVASLLLLRAERRRREIAVRLALGMGRGRLLAQLLTESVVLTAIGLLAAVALTAWGGATLRSLLLPDAAPDAWAVDGRMLLVVTAAAVTTVLLTGLLPAVRAGRTALRDALVSGTSGPGGSARRPALQRPLLVAQVALSTVLLVGAGLFLRSLHNVRTEDLGMQTHRVLAVRPELTSVGWQAPETEAFFERAAERLRAVPGLERVAVVRNVPLAGASGMSIHLPAADSVFLRPADEKARNALYNAVGPGYFEALGMRLVQGRFIDERDGSGAPPVAVVSELMARLYWSNQSPIGRCMTLGDMTQCTTVVGVVRDARLFRIREEPRSQLFLPLQQRLFRGTPAALLVRTTGDADRHAGRVRQAVQELAPELPYVDVRSLQSIIDPQARPWQVGATMFTVFGGFAILLAALGLYSAIAYGVTMRTRELGVRLALGAPARHVAGRVLREGTALALLGLAIGTGLALVASARIADLLFDVSPRDAGVYGAVAVVLLLSALLACLVPAYRATRVDPVVALRSE